MYDSFDNTYQVRQKFINSLSNNSLSVPLKTNSYDITKIAILMKE